MDEGAIVWFRNIDTGIASAASVSSTLQGGSGGGVGASLRRKSVTTSRRSMTLVNGDDKNGNDGMGSWRGTWRLGKVVSKVIGNAATSSTTFKVKHIGELGGPTFSSSSALSAQVASSATDVVDVETSEDIELANVEGQAAVSSWNRLPFGALTYNRAHKSYAASPFFATDFVSIVASTHVIRHFPSSNRLFSTLEGCETFSSKKIMPRLWNSC
jgi:hypothetical protein